MSTPTERARQNIDAIKDLRATGKTQKEIADKLGLTQPLISMALRGELTARAVTVAEPRQIEASQSLQPEAAFPLVHLVARDPQQMAAAQSNLSAFLQTKRDGLMTEIRDLERARAEAKRNNWAPGTFNSAISKFRAQHDYYHKILEAVRAGFTLVPNFPIDVFAIRVEREWPTGGEQYGGTSRASYLSEQPDVLPIGAGEYKSPKPTGRHFTKTETDSNQKIIREWYYHPRNFRNPDFPFAVARPEVMDATAEAMALKLFDHIGICHQTAGRNARQRGKGDPLIIGQIIVDATHYGYIKKPVSFLIAWHLDLRTL